MKSKGSPQVRIISFYGGEYLQKWQFRSLPISQRLYSSSNTSFICLSVSCYQPYHLTMFRLQTGASRSASAIIRLFGAQVGALQSNYSSSQSASNFSLVSSNLAQNQTPGEKGWRECVLPDEKTYQEIVQKFKWNIPQRYNIAQSICDRHVQAGRGVTFHPFFILCMQSLYLLVIPIIRTK
jgi:hypothetical protein